MNNIRWNDERNDNECWRVDHNSMAHKIGIQRKSLKESIEKKNSITYKKNLIQFF